MTELLKSPLIIGALLILLGIWVYHKEMNK